MPQALPLIFAGIGAAASVAGVINATKARQEAAEQAKKQELTAKNAAALESTAESADANFQLGTDDPKKKTSTATATGKSSTKPTSGLSTGGISASSVGGL